MKASRTEQLFYLFMATVVLLITISAFWLCAEPANAQDQDHWYFTTGAVPLPDAPTLVAPAVGDTVEWFDAGELIFKPGDFNVAFRLQISTEDDFSPVIHDRVFGFLPGDTIGYADSIDLFIPIPDGIEEVTYIIFGLQASTTYYWRVRSWNESGWGPWSGN